MIDDLLSLKAATIGRCVSRARYEYARAPNTFAADLPARDAAILNSLCARQEMQDTGRHPIHHDRFGAPQGTRNLLMIVPTLTRLDAECPTLGHPRWSVGPSHRPCLYASCIEEQWYRLSKKKKSRDYKSDDGLESNSMTFKGFLKTRKQVHPGLFRAHQYAISQTPI